MQDIPLPWLFGILVLLLTLSAFFSSTETALMSINRYRLRHRAREGSVGARAAERLLAQPDRLIGLILVCNNFVNSAAAAIVTVISLSLGGEAYAAIGVGIFTVVLIIFGEVAPKTFGALYPERLALPAALVYEVLLKVLYPVVWATNLLANGVLRLLGISREKASTTSLSREELRTVVAEASTVIPHRHQRMLMSILDLERINVEDIMVPRNEIAGLDVSDDWDDILDAAARQPPHAHSGLRRQRRRAGRHPAHEEGRAPAGARRARPRAARRARQVARALLRARRHLAQHAAA